jgi:hypothetical protein
MAVVAAPLVAQDRAQAQASATPQAQAKPSDQMAPPPPPPPLPTPGMGRNVQVDLTVKLDGSGPAITKHMTLVAADGTVAMGRAGMDVPVAVGSGNQYRSVGLNVDARPRIFESNRVSLSVKLEFSSVMKAEGVSSNTPSFGSAKTELFLALDSGKPLVVSQAADAEVGRGYTVEVKATILR